MVIIFLCVCIVYRIIGLNRGIIVIISDEVNTIIVKLVERDVIVVGKYAIEDGRLY